MGTHFEISVVYRDSAVANEYIEEAISEIKRIEGLLTLVDDSSQINHINKSAGIKPVVVSREIYQLIERSISLCKKTQGTFDITNNSLDKKYWNDDTIMTGLSIPDKTKPNNHLVNYKYVILNPGDHSIFLSKAGMQLGLHGMAKGYAMECAKRKLQNLSIDSGIINASGDLCTWGLTPDGRPWKIGVADPYTRLKAFSEMELTNKSIATSVNYEKMVFDKEVKYSISMHPGIVRTGYGIASVSILSPNAELSEALTNSVMVMGISNGLQMINQMKDVGCIIIDENHSIFTSNDIILKS
jgi:thiamine biosynthesis lipoprotein